MKQDECVFVCVCVCVCVCVWKLRDSSGRNIPILYFSKSTKTRMWKY